MRLTRIYFPEFLQEGSQVLLDARNSHHLLRVLRLKINDPFIIFDGQKHEFHAQIIGIFKQAAQILVKEASVSAAESPLSIHLGQAISRGEKMDYTLQKAVELGVKTVTPLFTEYTGVKLPKERLDNKVTHWQQIIVSACEQSGRSYVPQIQAPEYLPNWLKQRHESYKLILHPGHGKHLKDIAPVSKEVCILVGPEGGFSDNEILLAQQADFEVIGLGPRILRTETAAPAAIAALQCLWGDMG